jgi:hypothetical protein
MDSSGTVRIAGNLSVAGSVSETNVDNLQIADLTVTLAHNNTAPQTDAVADGAAIIIEGNSGYNKFLRWSYNQGLAYKPPDSSHFTGDGELLLLRTLEVTYKLHYCNSHLLYCLQAYLIGSSRAVISASQGPSLQLITCPTILPAGHGAQTTLPPQSAMDLGSQMMKLCRWQRFLGPVRKIDSKMLMPSGLTIHLLTVVLCNADYSSPASSGGGYNAVGATAKIVGFFGKFLVYQCQLLFCYICCRHPLLTLLSCCLQRFSRTRRLFAQWA